MATRSRRWAVAGVLVAVTSPAALAGSFQVGESVDVEWKLTFNYALGMRVEEPDDALINGPVDRFQASFLPAGQPDPTTIDFPNGLTGLRIVGFSHTGLPESINFDDGNRNFRAGDLFNNRLAVFAEVHPTWENFGLLANGTAFYDQVFHDTNANDSPDTVNKYEGPHNEFHPAAKYYNGERARLLEAYVYGDYQLGDASSVNVRVGRHLAAWGESLFFPGITSAQGPNDATKAFVPGAEIKEILLPVNQVSMQLTLTDWLTLLGQYQFEFKPTEIFPVGDFFSPADVVGPGAEFVYGSLNPAFANGCPGLFDPLTPLEAICDMGGLGGDIFNAGPYIIVPRAPDILPDQNPWGVALKWAATTNATFGFYYLSYANHNPSVQLNPGYAQIGTTPTGDPITTETLNQVVPVTYNIKYFGDVKMSAVSWSTVAGIFNVAGEFIYREGIDTSIVADISGVRSPVATRANTFQTNVSAIYAANPDLLWYDEVAIVGEAAYLRVKDVDAVPDSQGIDTEGDGDHLFYDKSSWGANLLVLSKGRDIVPGWDLLTTINTGAILKGNPSVPGTFGALFGTGDTRFSVAFGMQYLQNLEFNVGYNMFIGDASRKVNNSIVHANPYVDRDNVTFNIKYSL